MTKLVIEEFKGNRVFAIKNVEADGTMSQYAVISFGDRKAKAILEHIEEIKAELAASAPELDQQEEMPV